MTSSNDPSIERYNFKPYSPRRQERRRIKIYVGILLALIFLFSILRSQDVIFVALLYISIIMGGILLIFLISVSEVRGSDEDSSSFEDEMRHRREYEGNSIIESINVYVKYASKGSEFSRREIALNLRKLIGQREEIGDDSLSEDISIQRDLRLIVYPYLDERSYVSRTGNLSKETIDAFELKGDAYLASLGRIVTKLKTSMIS